MVSAFEESENRFNEDSQELVTLDSKGETAVSSLREAETIAQSQYEMYED